VISPVAVPDLYDFVVIDGQISPGIAVVTGCDRKYSWDVKAGKGNAGASTTFQGDEISKPKVEFLMWLDEHFEAWDNFVQILRRAVGPKPNALTVVHPDFQENDISACTIDNIGQRVAKGRGLHSVTVSFLEYKPPKPKGGDPKAKGWIDTTDKADAELAALLEKAKAA
jgi:hypothetical protein